MAALRFGLLGLLALLLAASADAAPLHDDPFLTVEPGMHTAPINRLDVDAAGRFLVTASDDKTVRVWAAADGRLLRTIRMPAGPEHVGKAYAVAISPDGETIAAGGWTGLPVTARDSNIYLFERRSGRMVGRLGGLENVVLHLAFSPDGRRLVACLGGGEGIRVFEADAAAAGGWREALADRDYGDDSYWAAFAADGRLATTSWDGHVRLYGADLGAPRKVKAPGGSRPFGIAWSPDGGRLVVGYEDSSRVDILDGRSLEPLAGPETGDVGNGNLERVAFSADGRRLLAGGRFQRGGDFPILAWAADGSGKAREVAVAQNTIMDLRPLGDGRLAFAAQDPRLGMLDADLEEIWSKGPSQADFRDQRSNLGVSADGRRLRFRYEPWGREASHLDLASRRLDHDPPADADLAAPRQQAPGLEIERWFNSTDPSLNGESIRLKALEISRALAIAPDAERFVLGTEWYLRAFDRSGAEQWNVPAPSTTWAVNITGDGRLVVAAFGDGTIRWYRLSDGEGLLAFYPDGDRERWVVWTRQGYYMVSPGGEDLIGWQVNRGFDEAPEFYGASRFRDRYNRPDIVDLVLDELDVGKAVARANAKAGIAAVAPAPVTENLPPRIELISHTDGMEVSEAEQRIEFRLFPPQKGRVDRVKLRLGDKVVMQPVNFAVPKEGIVGWIPVTLWGEDVAIALTAEAGTQASDTVVAKLVWAGKAVPPVRRKPTLHVLAIGISDYGKDNEHLRLRFADNDALDLTKLLGRQEGMLYDRVLPNPLVDSEATERGIRRGLQDLRREMRDGDVAMILFSGHGTEIGGSYYLVPHGVDARDSVGIQYSAIDYDNLKKSLKDIAAIGKTLVFLDACRSGAVGKGSKPLPPDYDRLVADLAAQDNGVIVFASSTGAQLSREDEKTGHGLFTEALIEAFGGAADDNHDDVITVSELQRFVTQRVPDLSDGAQNPRIEVPFQHYFEVPIAIVPR